MGNNISSSRHGEFREFKVYNVDAKLFKHSKGKIMITDENMILSQENSDAILWPLKGIRRYGSYQDIFLFECGRKCPTGEGLFAFKCSKAQMLNDCLHVALTSKSEIVNILPAMRNDNENAAALEPQVLPTVNGLRQNENANPGSGYINVIKLSTESSENSEFNQIRNICFNDNNNNSQITNSINLNYVTIDRELSSSDDQAVATAAALDSNTSKVAQKTWAHAKSDAYSVLSKPKTNALHDTQHRNQNIRNDYLSISSMQ